MPDQAQIQQESQDRRTQTEISDYRKDGRLRFKIDQLVNLQVYLQPLAPPLEG